MERHGIMAGKTEKEQFFADLDLLDHLDDDEALSTTAQSRTVRPAMPSGSCDVSAYLSGMSKSQERANLPRTTAHILPEPLASSTSCIVRPSPPWSVPAAARAGPSDLRRTSSDMAAPKLTKQADFVPEAGRIFNQFVFCTSLA